MTDSEVERHGEHPVDALTRSVTVLGIRTYRRSGLSRQPTVGAHLWSETGKYDTLRTLAPHEHQHDRRTYLA